MELYKAELKDEIRCDWDEFDSMVIAARNWKEANEILQDTLNHDQKGKDIWEVYLIAKTSIYNAPMLVCASFNAG